MDWSSSSSGLSSSVSIVGLEDLDRTGDHGGEAEDENEDGGEDGIKDYTVDPNNFEDDEDDAKIEDNNEDLPR